MTWFFTCRWRASQPCGWDWEALASMPRPTAFLGHYSRNCLGQRSCRCTRRRSAWFRVKKGVATGFCGTKEVGYRWVERECLETSAVPYHVAVETYGCRDGGALAYCFDDAGQAGHAAFRHVSLRHGSMTRGRAPFHTSLAQGVQDGAALGGRSRAIEKPPNPALPPDRGRIAAFQGTMSHRWPRQVSWVIRRQGRRKGSWRSSDNRRVHDGEGRSYHGV